MTYLTFHLALLLPPILLLALTLPKPLAGRGGKRARWSLPLVCLLALLYTTPWDNYLVYRGVWWYGSDRVLFTIGYVPFEEYLFFILQPLLTGLTLYHLLARTQQPTAPLSDHRTARLTGTFAFLALSVAGAALLLLSAERTLYLGLILAWASPVLAGLWFYGGGLLWQLRRPLAAGVLFPTLYLWGADRLALALDIWTIADQYTLGVSLLGLPLEEALFFLLTNLLVAQGLLLFLYGDYLPASERWAATKPVSPETNRPPSRA